jgi:Mg2+ and Co2+ transporter CorA
MCSIAEDLRVDPWDIFTPNQEKPLKMLATQSNQLSEIADALIKKADSQEDSFSQTQETATNNLLFNLTMFTIVMMPPQFFTGVYGMNFEDGMWELKDSNGYAILWGRCALHCISPCNHRCSHVSLSLI